MCFLAILMWRKCLLPPTRWLLHCIASVINLLLQPPEAPHHSCCCCSSKCWWTAYQPIFLLISVFKRLSVKFTAMLSPNFCKPLESYTWLMLCVGLVHVAIVQVSNFISSLRCYIQWVLKNTCHSECHMHFLDTKKT